MSDFKDCYSLLDARGQMSDVRCPRMEGEEVKSITPVEHPERGPGSTNQGR
jgi:hypothetical protein